MVAFCASANGEKLPPVIIIPRKMPLKNYQAPDNVVLVYKTKATFNTSVLEDDFIDRVVIPHKLKNKLNNVVIHRFSDLS